MADRPRSLRFPMPRLLPVTIMAMAMLLVMKSVTIVMAATGTEAPQPPAAGIVPPAKAAEPAPVTPAPNAADLHGATKAGNGAAPKVEEPTIKPLTSPEPVVSDSERALLTNLRQRRQQLDAREANLAAREMTLAAVEKRLSGRVDELTALQNRLEDLERQRKSRDETNWRGMVKVYEAMKPRDAANIFNDLDMPILLPVIDRMKEAKASAILAAMLPERARQVTAELAQMRARQNSIEAGSATPQPAGG